MTPSVIALVGPRGAGKSTVGRLAAERLGWSLCDADEALGARVGMPAGEYLRRHGEPEFRRVEGEVTSELLGRERVVVALGGGGVLCPSVQQQLARAQVATAFLCAPVATLVDRIRDGGDRPALTSLPLEREVEAVLCARLQLYRSFARVEIDTAATSPVDAAAAVAALVVAAR